MTREQILENRNRLVNHLEECRELIKVNESYYKKYNFRLFWALQRDLGMRVRAENGLAMGLLLGIVLSLAAGLVVGPSFIESGAIQLIVVLALIGVVFMIVEPSVAAAQLSAMDARDAKELLSVDIQEKLPGVSKICYTEKGLKAMASYIKNGKANSLAEASELYVDSFYRKFHWFLRGLDGLTER